MLEHVAANPTSPFAHAYRSYVREVLVPRLNLIADIITQHGAYIEYPPMDYFKERFSGEASWGFCKTQCSSLSVFLTSIKEADDFAAAQTARRSS